MPAWVPSAAHGGQLTGLDATIYPNEVLQSDGVNWTPSLITTANLDPNTTAAIVTATEAVLGAPAIPRPGWTTGRPGVLAPAGITLTGLYNVVMLSTFWVAGPVTIDNIGINVIGTGTGVLRMGMLSLNNTGTPVTFLQDFGTVSVTSTGAKAVGAFTPLVLPIGVYYIASCWQTSNATPPTLDAYIDDDFRLKSVDSAPPIMAIAGAFGGTLTVPNLVTGAFPGTLGGLGSTPLVSSGGVGFAPRVIPHILSSP